MKRGALMSLMSCINTMQDAHMGNEELDERRFDLAYLDAHQIILREMFLEGGIEDATYKLLEEVKKARRRSIWARWREVVNLG